MKTDLKLIPCKVEIIKKRKHGFVVETEWVNAGLYDFYQYSEPISPSPMVGGHPGGVVAYPCAVVRLESGEFKTVKANQVSMKLEEELDKCNGN
ncbi:hypothetical protein ACFC3A_12545 [Enterococcus thailandicus]|uniref:hypothetical protein n=1 Tax=Enterococcus thailandicus TaxID=417368 RepID=UPI0039A70557